MEKSSSSIPRYIQGTSTLVHWSYYIGTMHLYHAEGSTCTKCAWKCTTYDCVLDGIYYKTLRKPMVNLCRVYMGECWSYSWGNMIEYKNMKVHSSSQYFQEEELVKQLLWYMYMRQNQLEHVLNWLRHARCTWKCWKKQNCTNLKTGNGKPRMRHVCRKTGKYMKPVFTQRKLCTRKIISCAHNHRKSTFSTRSVLVLV